MADSEWEKLFSTWAQPPSSTEQTRSDNAVTAVRNAVNQSDSLKDITNVFVQGSYRNRVNVKQDSDVDIGVICTSTYVYSLVAGRTQKPSDEDAQYTFAHFKNDLETALRSHFRTGVERGNKAFKLRENSYHVDADVVPLFYLKELAPSGEIRRGVSLLPDNGGHRINNYPERLGDDWPNQKLHYENGVEKNTNTSRRFKSVVRIAKKLRNIMDDEGINSAETIPGYLIECLVYNTPDHYFNGNSWLSMVRGIFDYVWSATKSDGDCSNWMEVDRIKFLFHPLQPWEKAQANAFISDAWTRIGVT